MTQLKNEPKSERLTVILLSYNRRDLLKKAVESCFNQTRHDFDLIIVDNGSTDGAREFIEKLQHREIRIKKIFNKENLGAPFSELMGVENSETLWVTYLCDDDQYEFNFIESYYEINKEDISCVVFSTKLIDPQGEVISYGLNQDSHLTPNQAIISILNNQLRCAGISNFTFRKTVFNSNRMLPFYPFGFFRDTLLVTRAVSEKGVVTSSKVTYKRLIHEGSTSTYSDQKIFGFYKAMLEFNKDLEKEIFSNQRLSLKSRYLKVSFRQFFESVLFQIITLGKLNLISAWSYVSFSLKFNRRFLFYALILFMMSPFLSSMSLPLRRKLNYMRKKLW